MLQKEDVAKGMLQREGELIMLKKFANLKLGTKLALLVGGGLLQLACLSGMLVWAVHSFEVANAAAEFESQKMVTAQRIPGDIAGAVLYISEMVIKGQSSQDLLNRVADMRQRYRAELEEAKGRTNTVEGRRLVEAIDEKASAWRDANNRILQLLEQHKSNEAAKMYGATSAPMYSALKQVADNYVQWQQQRLAEIAAQRQAMVWRVYTTFLILGVVSLITGSFAGVLVSRSINRPLSAVIGLLQNIAKGDLSSDVPAECLGLREEVGMLASGIQRMTGGLREMVRNMAGDVQSLSSSASDLSASSGQMSGGSRKASEKVHAVAAAAEQM